MLWFTDFKYLSQHGMLNIICLWLFSQNTLLITGYTLICVSQGEKNLKIKIPAFTQFLFFTNGKNQKKFRLLSRPQMYRISIQLKSVFWSIALDRTMILKRLRSFWTNCLVGWKKQTSDSVANSKHQDVPWESFTHFSFVSYLYSHFFTPTTFFSKQLVGLCCFVNELSINTWFSSSV